jgi:hypothetical protein
LELENDFLVSINLLPERITRRAVEGYVGKKISGNVTRRRGENPHFWQERPEVGRPGMDGNPVTFVGNKGFPQGSK